MDMEFVKYTLLLYLFIGTFNAVNCAKILAIFAHIGKSHFDVFEPYLEQLSIRGHEVLVISHFPRKQSIPNYRDIDLRGTFSENRTTELISYQDLNSHNQIASHLMLSFWGAEACEKTLEHPDVQKLIKSNDKFDLLITETFNTDCFLAFAYKYQIPIVAFSSCVFMPWTPGRVGNPDNPAYIPTQFVTYSDRMDFTERLLNTFWYTFHKLLSYVTMDARVHMTASSYFGKELPAMSAISKNTSIIFVNNHFSVNRPRPLVPGVVEIAGIHIKPTKKLPKMRHALVLAALCWHVVTCADILAIFPHVGKSHYDVYNPYLQELAARGHHVSVMSHFPQEQPVANLTDISIKASVQMPGTGVIHFQHVESKGTIQNAILLADIARAHCDAILQLPQVHGLLKQNTFDLVITELFNTDCFLGIVQLLNVPFIYFSSSVLMPWANDRFGNPDNPSYIPNLFVPHSDRMSFMERMYNTIDTLVDKWLVFPYYFDKPGHALAEKHLGVKLPSLPDISKRGSLILVNSHFSLNRPRPLVPAVVEVGGIHLSKNQPKKLPQDIEDYLNGAEHGVIYFSMGSMIRAETLPPEKRDAFLQAFAELPQRVLWKWENETLPGQPENVKIGKWLPQFDILNHPKTRVFLAHGGLLGTIEAVHVGVPMVGIPMYGDQSTNIKMVEAAGMAIKLNYADITKENVLKALKTVLDNPSYSENAKRTSRAFRDRPMSPMDTAIYWTEYVIRHKGAPHMRTAGADLPLYQYLLLDVIAALLAAILAVLYVTIFMLKKLASLVSRPKDSATKRQK